MDHYLLSTLEVLHQLPVDVISVIVLLSSLTFILVAWRYLGILGLYVYQVIVLVAANIQVLRLSYSYLSPEPIALGTVVFATTYVAQDIINRHYGKEAAYRGVWLGFYSQLLFTVTMFVSLGYAPFEIDKAYHSMEYLFVPSIRLSVSSLLAYWVSHMLNVRLFATILNYQKMPLWMVVSISSWMATFIDHFLFSFFAWQLLADQPVSGSQLWYSYIWPSFLPRVLIVLVTSPILTLTTRWQPRERYV